ncbi:MAG: hypothetical protein ACR2JZ_02640 [Candidatus Limnocylindrales bacterium]
MEKPKPSDPGAYIGHEPELSADTIPDGVQPDDDRIAGNASQSSGTGAGQTNAQEPDTPEGHRQGSRASDDDVRRAGENG